MELERSTSLLDAALAEDEAEEASPGLVNTAMAAAGVDVLPEHPQNMLDDWDHNAEEEEATRGPTEEEEEEEEGEDDTMSQSGGSEPAPLALPPLDAAEDGAAAAAASPPSAEQLEREQGRARAAAVLRQVDRLEASRARVRKARLGLARGTGALDEGSTLDEEGGTVDTDDADATLAVSAAATGLETTGRGPSATAADARPSAAALLHETLADALSSDEEDNDDGDCPGGSKAALREEVRLLRRSLRDVHESLLQLRENASLKQAKLELQVAYWKKAQADTKAYNAHLLQKNKALQSRVLLLEVAAANSEGSGAAAVAAAVAPAEDASAAADSSGGDIDQKALAADAAPTGEPSQDFHHNSSSSVPHSPVRPSAATAASSASSVACNMSAASPISSASLSRRSALRDRLWQREAATERHLMQLLQERKQLSRQNWELHRRLVAWQHLTKPCDTCQARMEDWKQRFKREQELRDRDDASAPLDEADQMDEAPDETSQPQLQSGQQPPLPGRRKPPQASLPERNPLSDSVSSLVSTSGSEFDQTEDAKSAKDLEDTQKQASTAVRSPITPTVNNRSSVTNLNAPSAVEASSTQRSGNSTSMKTGGFAVTKRPLMTSPPLFSKTKPLPKGTTSTSEQGFSRSTATAAPVTVTCDASQSLSEQKDEALRRPPPRTGSSNSSAGQQPLRGILKISSRGESGGNLRNQNSIYISDLEKSSNNIHGSKESSDQTMTTVAPTAMLSSTSTMLSYSAESLSASNSASVEINSLPQSSMDQDFVRIQSNSAAKNEQKRKENVPGTSKSNNMTVIKREESRTGAGGEGRKASSVSKPSNLGTSSQHSTSSDTTSASKSSLGYKLSWTKKFKNRNTEPNVGPRSDDSTKKAKTRSPPDAAPGRAEI